MERSFEPGRSFANRIDYQLQLDYWFQKRANGRRHKTLRCRPIDRLLEERQVMAPLRERAPDTERRRTLRVAGDPYLRFVTCGYSLDPRLVGRRVEARITAREVLAMALDSGEFACHHERSFAKHRTDHGTQHARALRELRGQPQQEPAVELRPLARYDAPIA